MSEEKIKEQYASLDHYSAESKEQLIDSMAEAMQCAEMPDLKAIICAFLRRSGGADGIARMLMKEYNESKSGSMIRSMILQMILQGSKAISSKEQARDASMISDEDLEKELKKIVNSVPKSGKYAGAEDGGIQPEREEDRPTA